MKINYLKKIFLEQDSIVSHSYENNGVFFYINVWIYSDKFKEYQKNLFNDLYTEIIDLIEKNELFLDFKKHFEAKIKQFNTQLKIFQEKVKLENKIEIKWDIQIIWDNNFIASLIGESSIIIYRNNKLEVVVANELEEDDKIDIFSEIIEWELEDNDKIVSVACNIYDFMSDTEIKELIKTDDILDSLESILSMRIDKSNIWFIVSLDISIEKVVLAQKNKIDLEKYKDTIRKNKYVIWIVIGLWIVFFVIISIFSYIGRNENRAVVKVDGKKVELDLTALKREIDAFSKLWNENTEEKQAKYNKIMKELSLYEKWWIQKIEIKELKKIMEQNYYKWFNINIVNENDGILNKIYSLSENDKKVLEKKLWIRKGIWTISIFWNKWVIVWLVNDKVKWVSEKLKIPANIKTCINNLGKNGLYCLIDIDDIYNFSKLGIKSLKNNIWTWWKNIISIWTFGRSNLYTLSLDKEENQKNIYIKRYIVRRNGFSSPINYPFSKKADKELINSIYSGSSMVIDGSFLIWSKKWLLQAYKPNRLQNYLTIRKIKWIENWIIDKKNDLKWKVKVISAPDSSYVYLYDYNTKSLIAYYSKYKKTEWGKYSYNLSYLYKVRFDLSDEDVVDVDVLKNNAYILTDKSIYKLDLNQFKE